MKPWLRTALMIAGAILLTACVSVATTITVMNARRGERVILDAEEYQAFQSLLPILELLEKVEQEHYGEDVSREDLIDGALKGILESTGDQYARYYSEEEYIDYLAQLDGSYRGIGAVIGQPGQDGAPILTVYEKSPAEEAGLLAGDILVSVDGVALAPLSLEEIERLFHKENGEAFSLGLLRGTDTLSISVQQGAGVTTRVVHKLFQQRTGYISIDAFTGSAAEEFSEAIRDLTDRGMRSLVIDLRNNPGGELKQVVSIADLLMEDSPIVTVRSANGTEEQYVADSHCVSVPLAILVNGNSASASEILAAAVQDTGRAIVVGMPTYGKGVVQTTMQLRSNHAWVKMTTAAYYTPSGANVDGRGIMPDIEVDLEEALRALPIAFIPQEDDSQLWAALDVIREQADILDDLDSEEAAALSEDDAPEGDAA